MHVIATAGHVDHGKSALVRALTGTDPDRWEEERSRGLTIDLGFASFPLPSGALVAFVDVPGHRRFLKNMLAGVGAVAACCFVVDCREGWRAQSEEHLRILELLGIEHGVVALSKVGGVDDEVIRRARSEIRDRIAGTFLADSAVVATDALEGIGLDELTDALDALTGALPPPLDVGRPRMWIDRVFAARGAGTVVTGTLAGGGLDVGDQLDVLTGATGRPTVRSVRVRALQALHRAREHVDPGSRVAVNLVGVTHHDLGRGDVLVRSGQWHLATVADVEMRTLDSLTHPVSRRGAFVAHIGSGEHPTNVRVIGEADHLAPGEVAPIRLRWARPLPLLPGDRLVLRESGRGETVGGGRVLEVDPVLPPRRARPDLSVDRIVAERGWIEVDDLRRRTGLDLEPTVGRWVVAPAVRAAATADLVARIDAAAPLGLDLAALDDRERALLDGLDGLDGEDGVAITAGRALRGPGGDDLDAHPFLLAARAAPFHPPDRREIDPAELAALRRRGAVVEHDRVVFATTALAAAATVVGPIVAAHPEGVGVGPLRDALGTTRKYAIPLLALLDRAGVTRRVGDLRVPGRNAAR